MFASGYVHCERRCYEATTAEAWGTALVEQMFPDKTTLAPHRKRRLQARSVLIWSPSGTGEASEIVVVAEKLTGQLVCTGESDCVG